MTTLIGNHAVKVISDYAAAKKPFFLSLHFNAPHWPWEGPEDKAVADAKTAEPDFVYAGAVISAKTWARKIANGEQKFSFDVMGPALAAIKTVDGPTLSKCLIQVSVAGIDRLSDKAVCAALKAFDVDLSRHFTIDRTYLELLTKSEIEAVCKEVKLDKALGDHRIKWHWVKGHAGHHGNERADQLANRGVDSVSR